MEFTNLLYKQGVTDEAVDALLLLMAPMAPHVTAELWERRHGTHIHAQAWPEADPDLVRHDTVTMIVQVNGKVRDRLDVSPDIDEAEAERLALASDKVQEQLAGGSPRKVIAKPPKLVNIVA
jgi:leucyl-tRNA synthetase